MTPEQATWVRENVWPPSWLRHYQFLPGPFTDCSCQRPPSVECQMSQHTACQHDGHPVRETVIQTSIRRAAMFREPYQHRTPAGSNGRRDAYGTNNLAWVWLVGPPCREICTCFCHQPGAVPAATTAAPRQLDLFQAVTA